MLQNAAEHLRAGHGQQQGQRQFGGWLFVQHDVEQSAVLVQIQHRALAHQSVDAADSQGVANADLLDVQHMGQAAAAKANMVRVDEISLFKQQQVHACGLSC